MSKMVSARVSDAPHEQGALQLSALESSTSELINAAFEYFLQERQLPTPQRDTETIARSPMRAMTPAVRFAPAYTVQSALSPLASLKTTGPLRFLKGPSAHDR